MGAAAAVAWCLLCFRWFDSAAPWRPAWLASVPPTLLWMLVPTLVAVWLVGKWPHLRPPVRGPRGALLLAVSAAAAFRLPLLWHGSAGYLSADGALSGIVALRLVAGAEHHVFVPSVAYSGSLKSHVAALLMGALDPSRAFATASLAFYVLFTAGVFHLGLLFRERAAWAAVAGSLYVAFAPAFVTQYSLSNDGNYVEVLALGTWALWLAVRWVRDASAGAPLVAPIGLLLGLAFWCHLLAAVYLAPIALLMLWHDAPRTVRQAPPLVAGALLGCLPAILWNAANGWQSLGHFLPGELGSGAASRVLARLQGLAFDYAPFLLGYDPGHPALVDALLWGGAVLAAAAVVAAVATALRLLRPDELARALLLLLAVQLAVGLVALPYLPGNPRYLLFTMTPVPLLLARALDRGWRRWAMAALVAFGAASALAQAPEAVRADARWRGFVSSLEAAGVRWCYADFFVATRLNFLSGERITCSAKLGPVITEYFPEYRSRVEAAPAAALIPVNRAAAEKLERRLAALGVGYARYDWAKPVLLPSRKVDPAELFPARSFPLR